MQPGQRLCGRIDLIVVAASREGHKLVEVIGKPMRLAGQMHEAAFHGAGLGIGAHDLIAFGLVARDRADAGLAQLLNELRA